jgi:hypothetical protein
VNRRTLDETPRAFAGLAVSLIQMYIAVDTEVISARVRRTRMAGTTSRRPKKRATPRIRRKNVNIDQTKLDRVRKLLGTETETEAIDQALDMILFREELVQGIERIAGTGGVQNVFDADFEPE